MFINYYTLLDVSPSATNEELKQAAQTKLGKIKEAYTFLSSSRENSDSNEVATYYAVLEVNSHALAEDIKRAAQTQVNKIKTAYATLANSEQRQLHDEQIQTHQYI